MRPKIEAKGSESPGDITKKDTSGTKEKGHSL
jgi:hypothetical protein